MSAHIEERKQGTEKPLYTYDRFQITSPEEELQWQKQIWPQIWRMQTETLPYDDQRHHYPSLTASLKDPKTVAVLMKNPTSEEIVGFSYVSPDTGTRRGTYDWDRRIGHHMMIIVGTEYRNNGLAYGLMENQLSAASKSCQYDFIVGEYNANTGCMPDGHYVKGGFAEHVKSYPWENAEIISAHPIVSKIYGNQEFITFRLKQSPPKK